MKRDDIVTTLPTLHRRKGDCVAQCLIENDLQRRMYVLYYMGFAIRVPKWSDGMTPNQPVNFSTNILSMTDHVCKLFSALDIGLTCPPIAAAYSCCVASGGGST